MQPVVLLNDMLIKTFKDRLNVTQCSSVYLACKIALNYYKLMKKCKMYNKVFIIHGKRAYY